MSRRRFQIILTAALSTLPLTSRANAVTVYSWSNPADGSWSDPANWSTGATPTSAQTTTLSFPTSPTGYTATNDLPSLSLNFITLNGTSTGALTTLTGNPLTFLNNHTVQNNPAEIRIIPDNSPLLVQFDATIAESLRLTTTATSPLTYAGTLSGPGSLTVYSPNVTLTAPNTYTNGTFVSGGSLTLAAPNARPGPGTVTVSPPGGLFAASASNLTGCSVLLSHGGYAQFSTLDPAAVATISPASTGVLGIAPDTNIPTNSIDLTTLPGVRIGANTTSAVTLSASLTPASDNVYRFGGQYALTSSSPLDAPTLAVSSLLTDAPGGAPRSVDLSSGGRSAAGHVSLTNPNNSFTGGLTVQKTGSPLLSIDANYNLGQTPLGTGPVTVYGGVVISGRNGTAAGLPNAFSFQPGSTLYFDNTSLPDDGSTPAPDRWNDAHLIPLNSATVTLRGRTNTSDSQRLGPLSVAGNSFATIYRAAASSTVTTTMTLKSPTRVGAGTLRLAPAAAGTFGVDNVFRLGPIAPVIDPTTRMLAPWIVANTTSTSSAGDFVQSQSSSSSLLLPYPYATAFNPSSDNEIVSFTSPNGSYVFSNETAYAVRVTGGSAEQLLILEPNVTLSLRSGGLILNGSRLGGSPSSKLSFGTPASPAEALIYSGSNDATISAPLSAPAGLTKFGPNALTLSSPSNTIAGTITVNEGALKPAVAGALGPSPASVSLSTNGTLDLNALPLTLSSLTGTGTLTNNASPPATLTLDTPADTTFAGNFGNAGWVALTKTGTATFTLAGPFANTGVTTVSVGTLNYAFPGGPGNGLGGGAVTVAAGAHLLVSGPANLSSIDGDGDLTVTGGPSVKLSTSHVRLPSLTLAGSASLKITGSSTLNAPFYTSVLSSLTLSPTATLDLSNCALILNDPAPTAPDTLRQLLLSAYNHGTWTGPGLTSSKAASSPTQALAYARATDLTAPTFAGQPTTPTSLVVMYTLQGDANLDGRITPDDYALLDRSLAQHLSNAHWTDGDFNYDGQVDASDYLLIDRTLGQAQGFSPGFLSERESQFGAAYVHDLLTSIPEPASPLACLLTGLLFARRPRRRHP